jgi:hypothetical protein
LIIVLGFAVCPWPGVSAARVEQMVTRTMEAAQAQRPRHNDVAASTTAALSGTQIGTLLEGETDRWTVSVRVAFAEIHIFAKTL